MLLINHNKRIYQHVHRWRLDGDVDGVQVGLFDPLHPLDIHVQDADQVFGSHVFHRSLTEQTGVLFE